MAAPKPPITCHVLDTSIGKPAASIPVRLTLLSRSPCADAAPSFTATTNADGRVTSWTSAPAPFTSASSLADVFSAGPGAHKWELRFDTAAYFAGRGVQTLFPECVVVFVVREEQRGVDGGASEHFHVPVLVGGFGWSTYRGS
jgi:5-hydroxyisourate hydrolase